MYHKDEIPIRVDFKPLPGDRGNLPKGGRRIHWRIPVKQLDFKTLLPVFVTGLREKQEP